jgi:hypothetical protein
MAKSMLHDANSSFLGRAQLMKLRLKAIRSGMWFRSLSRIDRVLVDLTIKVAGAVGVIYFAFRVTNELTCVYTLPSELPFLI